VQELMAAENSLQTVVRWIKRVIIFIFWAWVVTNTLMILWMQKNLHASWGKGLFEFFFGPSVFWVPFIKGSWATIKAVVGWIFTAGL
jgi:hypothetical protein